MQSETEWFARRGWGVFCHYLTFPDMSADQWNRRVDAFDVNTLAAQLEAAGAGYFFITIGQGSGHFCAPNETYDRYAGIQPSKCSQRDLLSDLHEALTPRGIYLMAYLSSGGIYYDPVARKGLKLTHHWNDDAIVRWNDPEYWKKFRTPEFQRIWEEVCRDWSLRFRGKVKGWWIDGCFYFNERYPDNETPNVRTFAEALRAGNENAILAFNPGVRTPVICSTTHEDYTAGEISRALPECPGPWVELNGHKARYHVLTYAGQSWGKGAPRFPDDLVRGYTRHVMDKGGVVTWDVPIEKEKGMIPEPYLNQLKNIGDKR